MLEQAGEKVENIYLIAALVNDISNLTYPCIDDAITRVLFGDNEHNMSLIADRTNGIWNAVYSHINDFELVMQPVDIKRGIPNFDSCEIKDILHYINVIRSLCHASTTLTEIISICYIQRIMMIFMKSLK